jgi:hypothetical protein
MEFEALTPSVNDVEVKLRGVVCIPPLMAEADLIIAFMVVTTAHDALHEVAANAEDLPQKKTLELDV